MKKTYYLFLVLITVVVVACSNEDDLATNENGGWENIQPKTLGDGKYQALGYGYDITGEYLAHESIKRQVIDIKTFVFQNEVDYDNPYIGEIATNIYGGEDYFSYMKEIQKESGFEGSISYGNKDDAKKASFSGDYNKKNSSKYEYSSKYSFARGDIIKRLRQHVVYANATELSKYLSSNFKRDLTILSAAQIVENYGTHVLTDIEIGGMFTATFKSVLVEESNATSKTKAAKGGLSLNYKKIGLSLGSSSSVTETETYAYKNTNWDFNMRTLGGATNGYSISFTSKDPNPNNTLNFGQWAGTVDDTHCVLVGVNWEAAYPIYDLVTDPIKKAEIKIAVENYIKSKKVNILKVRPLYRMYDPKYHNTHLSTDMNEVELYKKLFGYYLDSSIYGNYIIGYIFENQEQGTVPLYKIFADKGVNSFVSAYWSDINSLITKYDFRLDNGHNGSSNYIMGYVFPKHNSEYKTTPLYRLYSQGANNTFFSSSLNEINHYKAQNWGYKDDYCTTGNNYSGYILPNE